MAGKCIYHSGRSATVEINGKKYCANCVQGQKSAAQLVHRHVNPKDCFVWYLGKDNWAPITGTGCAHWVAHQKGIRIGVDIHLCVEGYTIKVADIATGCKEVKVLSQVKVDDIYINPAKTHCGLVSKVQHLPGKPGASPIIQIEIEHCSSRQGGVGKNDFNTYFGSKGSFFR